MPTRRTARVLAAVLTSAALVVVPLRSDAIGVGSAVTRTAQGSTIPAPKDYFGFAMGTTGRLAGFDRIKQYFRLIGDRSDRVEYKVVDKTTLGNDYPAVFISSKHNLGDLDRIVRDNQRLATPGISESEARRLSEHSTPVYLIEGTLHSTEVGNTQALVDIVHRLATEKSDYTESARKCADCPLIMPYSETTDNLGMLLGVDVEPVDQAFTASLERVGKIVPEPARMPSAPRGAYLVPPGSYAVGHALSGLQKANVPVFRSGEEFEAAGRTFAPGTVVAIGSSSETARQLLNLPVRNATPTDRSEFSAPGALLRASYKPDVPAAWGMRETWPVWFNQDPAYRLTGEGTVASSYPDDGDLLASGYAHGTEALGGLANVVTFDVGKGHATLAGSEITFRSWPRASWPIVMNSIYHGPSEEARPSNDG